MPAAFGSPTSLRRRWETTSSRPPCARATGFGVGAYSAGKAGDVLVGAHSETGLGSNRHEELYVVLAGRALFEVDGEELQLGPEEFLLVRARDAARRPRLVDGTSVLVIGGAPGAVAPAPYEALVRRAHADTPAGAAEIAAAGLAAHPDHGQLNCSSPASRHSRESSTSPRGTSGGRLHRTTAHGNGSRTMPTSTLRSVPGAVPARTRVGPIYAEQAGAGSDVVLVPPGWRTPAWTRNGSTGLRGTA